MLVVLSFLKNTLCEKSKHLGDKHEENVPGKRIKNIKETQEGQNNNAKLRMIKFPLRSMNHDSSLIFCGGKEHRMRSQHRHLLCCRWRIFGGSGEGSPLSNFYHPLLPRSVRILLECILFHFYVLLGGKWPQ